MNVPRRAAPLLLAGLLTACMHEAGDARLTVRPASAGTQPGRTAGPRPQPPSTLPRAATATAAARTTRAATAYTRPPLTYAPVGAPAAASHVISPATRPNRAGFTPFPQPPPGVRLDYLRVRLKISRASDAAAPALPAGAALSLPPPAEALAPSRQLLQTLPPITPPGPTVEDYAYIGNKVEQCAGALAISAAVVGGAAAYVTFKNKPVLRNKVRTAPHGSEQTRACTRAQAHTLVPGRVWERSSACVAAAATLARPWPQLLTRRGSPAAL